MKLWRHKYDWCDNQDWYLPDEEEMMKAQLATALDEQIDAVLRAQEVHLGSMFRTAVQAGGAFGLYPLALASHFDKVYTFEPMKENLECLVKNFDQVPMLSHKCVIVPMPLWDTPGVEMRMTYPKKVRNSYGAHCLTRHYSKNSEGVVTAALDDWKLKNVDLLWLDIEGAELRALKGACWTVSANRPIVVLEDRTLPQMREYGTRQGQAVSWVCSAWDYRVFGKTHADVILVPNEWK